VTVLYALTTRCSPRPSYTTSVDSTNDRPDLRPLNDDELDTIAAAMDSLRGRTPGVD